MIATLVEDLFERLSFGRLPDAKGYKKTYRVELIVSGSSLFVITRGY